MADIKPRPTIVLRDLESFDDLSKLDAVEKEVWGLSEQDAMPLTMWVAVKEAGSVLVGAFDGDALAGFVFGFFGREHGQTMLHSHMLAVRAPYRDLDLGYKLKLAQRERALAMGIRQMTWTFDPLQGKNAHFNFAKLGVVSDTYKPDFYGPATSSVLHRNGTDRLWVSWPMTSRRVVQRLQGKAASPEPAQSFTALVRFNGDGRPARGDLSALLARQRLSIEIPGDINVIESSDPGLAMEWRLATRWAFTESLKAGFFVAEFYRSIRGQQGPGAYLLQKGTVEEFLQET